MLDQPRNLKRQAEPVVVKKYANRRLYNTETSTYVTLEDLAAMVRSDREFVVYDAKTGDDLTHSVLTQIIVEEESRSNSPNLLPTPFLRQLIRFYDDIGVSKMVPGYLQMSLETLAQEQERLRAQFAKSGWPPNPFELYQEQVRKNMEIFNQAMGMWAPCRAGEDVAGDDGKANASARTGGASELQAAPRADARTDDRSASGDVLPVTFSGDEKHSSAEGSNGPAKRQESAELTELRLQLAEMQRKIEELAKTKPRT
ncbi:MAG: polyhydroxyalkanoate synthesis repressor PhaR [Hyphomicrobiaceae bacterium]